MTPTNPTNEELIGRCREAGWTEPELEALARRLDKDDEGTLRAGVVSSLAQAPGQAPEPPPVAMGTADDLFAAGELVTVDMRVDHRPIGRDGKPVGTFQPYDLLFRVRPLTIGELAENSAAFGATAQALRAFVDASGPSTMGGKPGGTVFEQVDAEVGDDVAEMLSKLSKLPPDALRKSSELMSRAVCASVRAMSRDGGKTWEKLQVVPRQELHDKARGRLWHGALPQAMVSVLFGAAMRGAKGGAERVRTFRG